MDGVDFVAKLTPRGVESGLDPELELGLKRGVFEEL
jgi:hypothetical protein